RTRGGADRRRRQIESIPSSGRLCAPRSIGSLLFGTAAAAGSVRRREARVDDIDPAFEQALVLTGVAVNPFADFETAHEARREVEHVLSVRLVPTASDEPR